MSPHYEVSFSPAAQADLDRLTDYLLDRARDLDELAHAQDLIDMLRKAVDDQLSLTPWSFRKAGDGSRSTLRELIVPAGKRGYVALFEIESSASVVVLAVRHQLEDDYH
jgi:plasmid stabilization system protein ParE